MSCKLFVAFIERIDRFEKSEPVGRVKHQRHIQFSCLIEDGRELIIIQARTKKSIPEKKTNFDTIDLLLETALVAIGDVY
jgi:hypothetical protein